MPKAPTTAPKSISDPDEVMDRLSKPQVKCMLCKDPVASASIEARVRARIKAGKSIVWTALHEIYYAPERYGLDLPRINIKDPRGLAAHVRDHIGIEVDGRGPKNC